tara:strand:- start:1002 stop:1787 length:786 start_codon:yes stop_codon:yes gene_type:complete
MLGLGHNIATPMVSGEIPYSNDYYYTGTHATAAFVNTNSAMQSLFRSSWTFSGWFNWDDGQTNPPNGIMGALHDSNNSIAISTTKNDSKVIVSYKANGDLHFNTTDAVCWLNGPTGWVHVAVSMNMDPGGNVGSVIYIDGSAVSSTASATCTTSNAGSFTNTTNIFIGGANNAGTGAVESLRGDMDEVAFHSIAMGGAQIAELYNGGVSLDLRTISTSGDLVHYYTFNEQNGYDDGTAGSHATFAEEGYAFNAHSTPTSAP